MPSISINRKGYAGKTDAEIAEAEIAKLSDGYRYFAVVRYKNSSRSAQFTNFGFCEIPPHLVGYLNSEHCHEAEVIRERNRSI